MTDPIVYLDSDRLSVEPGGQVSVGIKITNPGTIVEGYRIEVVGEGVSGWGEALPPEVSIYPKQDGNAVIVFSPPGGTGAPGGTWPFGIRVCSTEDADASAVVEGDLEIGKVFGLQAKLVPVNSAGRWNGRHVVELSNWGNSPAKITLTATNPDDALGFMIKPEVVDLPLGGTAKAMVFVKTKKPFLRGTQLRLPFTVTGEQAGAAPQQGPALPYGGTPDRPTVDGAFNQKPIVSRGAVMIAALSLLAVGGGIAWALTRPPPAQATFQELGPPAQPQNVKVVPATAESVDVQWDAVPDVQGYTVVQVLENGGQKGSRDVPGTDTGTTVGDLAAGTKVCFKVSAKRGATPGPFSDDACAQLPAAGTSASPSTSGQPTDGASSPPATGGPSTSGGPSSAGGTAPPPPPPPPPGSSAPVTSPQGSPASSTPTTPGTATAVKTKWYGVGLWPISTTPQSYVEGKRAALQAKNVVAGVGTNETFPRAATPVPLGSPTWILYTGPFDTREQVQANCAPMFEVQSSCLPVQLEP
ncbi:fibronectin type III domain-containing protein [Microlunatus ginsengisoli]|uniref:fibronectin type III domain-containing protein n=1 Tax=Microlunatus ginsengisoli TaxID=363863 RepID=UPI0031DF0FF7